jgi:hypothetical protein
MRAFFLVIGMDEILVTEAFPEQGGGKHGYEFLVKEAANWFLMGLYEKHVILLDRFRDR